MQPRVQIIREVLGDEAGPRVAGKLNQQVRDVIRSKDSDLGQIQGHCLQASPQNSRGQARKSDHRAGLRFGFMGYPARYRYMHRRGCGSTAAKLKQEPTVRASV